MTAVATLPKRSEVKLEDTWDLSSLFKNDAEWETAFTAWDAQIPGYARFRGVLAESPARLVECLRFDTDFERAGERVGNYAFLKESEDASNSAYQGMKQRYMGVASKAAEAASYLRPEIIAIPDSVMQQFLASPEL